jgi:hypothetical protein
MTIASQQVMTASEKQDVAVESNSYMGGRGKKTAVPGQPRAKI